MLLILGSLLMLFGLAFSAAAADTSFARIERGRYLVNAGDCVACHTVPGGKPFAGGRAIDTPFGRIYAPNLTPDRETGIGAWSDDAFYKALHEGIGPDGTHFYPAFPYPYFTNVSRDDVLAIRAYLATLEPVSSRRPPPELMWPLNYRVFMNGWNWLYFDKGPWRDDPQKSVEWNRGGYLVEGLAHCGACHSPKSWLGGDDRGHALEGGVVQGWFAPDLTSNRRGGIGGWSTDDIVEYLKTGRNKRSGATGLMAEVVEHSTSKLRKEDLQAIAAYLQDHKGHPEGRSQTPSDSIMKAGSLIYADSCAGCHAYDGKGVPHMFSPLAESAAVHSSDPTTLIRIVLEGARTVATDARPTTSAMPAYGWKLSDGEIANVLTFVRNQWDNSASAVTVEQVNSVRNELHGKTR